jgi:type IV secretion system protein VirD4
MSNTLSEPNPVDRYRPDSEFHGGCGSDKFGPYDHQAFEPIITAICAAVSLAARLVLLGTIAWLVLRFLDNPWFYVIVGGLGFVFFRSYFPPNFGGLLGSAAFMKTSTMRQLSMFSGRGLILGRAIAPKGHRLDALLDLFTAPVKESEAAVRRFLLAISLGRLPVVRSIDRPIARHSAYVHTLLISPPGGGKNVSFIFPILLEYPDSVVVCDPKQGENFAVAAAARQAMGQEVIRIDPFEVHGPGGQTLNPFDLIHEGDRFAATSRALALSWVSRETGEREGSTHFTELAVDLLQALILFVCSAAKPTHRNPVMLRQILSDVRTADGSGGLRAAFAAMKRSDAAGGLLAELASKLDAIPEREFGSVMTTASRAIAFLGDEAVSANVRHTSFDLQASIHNTTVFLILPADLMRAYAALMKMWLSTFLLVRIQAGLTQSPEVLFILDECGNLGDLRCMEEAITVGRGFGIRLYLCMQSIDQLHANFTGPRADTIIAGCDTKIFMNINDFKTAKLASEMAGQSTIAQSSHQHGFSHNGSSSGSSRGGSISPAHRNLITPDEILSSQGALVFMRGQRPMMVSPIRYYDDPAFNTGSRPPRVSGVSITIVVLGLYFAWGFISGLLPTRPRTFSPPNTRKVFTNPGMPQWNLPSPSVDTRQSEPRQPEPVIAECPKCGQKAQAPVDYSGKLLRCKKCGTDFVL